MCQEMESSVGLYNALDDLTLCGLCRMRFNEGDMQPKFLTCKHYFCLKCIQNDLMRGQSVCCTYCYRQSVLEEGRGLDSFPTHVTLVTLIQNMTHLSVGGNGICPSLSLSKLSTTPTSTGSTTSSEFDGSSTTANNANNKSENCATHGMPHVSFCPICCISMCRACTQEHGKTTGHQMKPINRDQSDLDLINGQVKTEVAQLTKLIGDIHQLEKQQQEFLFKVLEACTTLKRDVELELKSGRYHSVVPEVGEVHDLLVAAKRHLQLDTSSGKGLHSSLLLHRQKLQMQYQELLLQCQLDELIVNSESVFDFPSIKLMLQALSQSKQPMLPANSSTSCDPVLFLANYCMSRLYPRHILNEQQQTQLQQNGESVPTSRPSLAPSPKSPTLSPQDKVIAPPAATAVVANTITRPPSSAMPLFFFNIEINCVSVGRIVIEARPDVAPRMVGNFKSLCLMDRGFGYKGCSIFQCWKGESIITGDFEHNNGRGGYSIYYEGFFTPDDTKLPAIRGSVGMRRTQKRHDSKGSVGSQFRIMLQNMQGFTAIFGRIVEGLELLDKISQYGDAQGTPTKTITVVNCGEL